MHGTRIAITGGPKTGKTTLALELAAGARIIHTDDYIDGSPGGWSRASLRLAGELINLHDQDTYVARPAPWFIEGVAVARALRKVRELFPGHRVIDRLIVLHNPPFVDWSRGQAAMNNGIHSALAEIRPWLLGVGVEIEDRS